MGSQGQLASGPQTLHVPASLLSDLYRKAGAEKVGLTIEEFSQILAEVGNKYLSNTASPSKASEFFRGLRVEELALARACAKGSQAAWDSFLSRYREKLYDAARSITREESAARELADSLYADLFGTKSSEGRRVAKLNHYAGLGSLEGWLRTVLAQEYVNRYRKQQRLVSLEEQNEAGVQFQAEEPDPRKDLDPRLEAATDKALLVLSAEEKFILACYYLDGRTLAQIAKILGVHESTISRRLEKIVASTRKRIVVGLVQRGMSRREADEALQVDVREISVDVRRRLMQEKGEPTVP